LNKRGLRVNGKDVAAALRRNGWLVVHTKGSHMQLAHPARSGKVTIPIHATTILLPKTLKSILEQCGITEDELREIL
jgi:predicted RNA binding protein YcfA (HicA-like mRNA interferase family)